MSSASFVLEVLNAESGERLRLRRAAAIPQIEWIDVEDSRRLWRVLHESYDICVVPREDNDPRGVAHIWYRRQMHRVAPGMVTFAEPGEVHVTKRLERPARKYWMMNMPLQFIAGAAAQLGFPSPPHLRLFKTTSAPLLEALATLHEAVCIGEKPVELRRRLADAVHLLLDEFSERKPRHRARSAPAGPARAREYIHEHFAASIPLSDLAAVAGLSAFHLTREFTRCFGIPPHAYQNQLRVTAAREQLRRGVRPSDVEAGFVDQSHLTRHFKRVWGVTPGEYAAVMGGTGPPEQERPIRR